MSYDFQILTAHRTPAFSLITQAIAESSDGLLSALLISDLEPSSLLIFQVVLPSAVVSLLPWLQSCSTGKHLGFVVRQTKFEIWLYLAFCFFVWC